MDASHEADLDSSDWGSDVCSTDMHGTSEPCEMMESWGYIADYRDRPPVDFAR
jgi:hypothetical protein